MDRYSRGFILLRRYNRLNLHGLSLSGAILAHHIAHILLARSELPGLPVPGAGAIAEAARTGKAGSGSAIL